MFLIRPEVVTQATSESIACIVIKRGRKSGSVVILAKAVALRKFSLFYTPVD